MALTTYANVSWERMGNAVEKVRQRLMRAAAALSDAKIPYAVAGGNAVAAWVTRADESAARNTQDVDIILRRTDLSAARQVLEKPVLFTVMLPVWTCFSTDRTQRHVTRFVLCLRPRRFGQIT
jgi:hypothetical protein